MRQRKGEEGRDLRKKGVARQRPAWRLSLCSGQHGTSRGRS